MSDEEEDYGDGEYDDEDESDANYLYVILFANGVLKVGQSRNVRQRYKTHRWWARQHGTTIAEVNIGLRYGTASPDERKLIAFCRDRWPALQGHREYFVGADFEEVDAYFMALESVASANGWRSEAS